MKKIFVISALAFGISNVAMADDLLTTAAADGSFKTFLEAVKTTGLDATLKGAGPYTLFVPSDAAFSKLPKAKLKALMADKEALKKVLSYHVVEGKIGKADVDAGKVKTLAGDDLALSVTDGVKVNNVKVTGSEIDADNGVIHIVESVLMPKKNHS
ncbi:MAG TPA: fasciclin domain-containing protein [Methylophilaceae bacterium]